MLTSQPLVFWLPSSVQSSKVICVEGVPLFGASLNSARFVVQVPMAVKVQRVQRTRLRPARSTRLDTAKVWHCPSMTPPPRPSHQVKAARIAVVMSVVPGVVLVAKCAGLTEPSGAQPESPTSGVAPPA